MVHKKQSKSNKSISSSSPNNNVIENDLKNLKDDFDDFRTEIRDLIRNEVNQSAEIHKIIFKKLEEVSSKIDYTRGQIDQHLKNNN